MRYSACLIATNNSSIDGQPMDDDNDLKHSAVDKALVLLKLLGDFASHGEVRLVDVVKASGYQRPTVHRLLATLKNHGFVEQDQEGGTYRLGSKIMALGAQAYGTADVREIARPFMLELSKKTSMTIHLAILDGSEVVYIDKIQALAPIQLASGIGWRGGLHCTALGKAITAFVGLELRNRALQAGLKTRTPHTIIDPTEFDAELARIVARGYAIDDQENEPEVRCVAAPIFNAAGRAVAGMSVSGTTSQVTSQLALKFGEDVRAACLNVSEKVGFRVRKSREAL